MTMITSPNTSAIPTVPRAPPYSASATIAPAPAKTRAKAANPSARARRLRSGRDTGARFGGQFLEQPALPSRQLVPDPSHGLEVLAGRILEFPVLVALARVD